MLSKAERKKHFEADLRSDAIVIQYLTTELSKVQRRAKKTQSVIEELKEVKKTG